MKYLRPLLLLLICLCSARAQDGFFILAKAPLTIVQDPQTKDFSFTNTGDKALHRIRIKSSHGNRQQSIVIIETLGPHKTVTYDISKSIVPGAKVQEATVTCANYSVPVKLEP
ncbi:MAG: hypothetical protein WCH43_08160 [Verrucomicrobiota bacterium]